MPQVGFPGRPPVLERFRQSLAAGALGQAYLFTGPEGSGKEVTALELARLVDCPRPTACDALPLCESCLKAVTFQHPDIRWIGPAPAGLTESEAAALLAAKRDDPFFQAPFAASSDVTIGSPDDPGPFTVRSLLRYLRVQPFQGRYKVAIVADAHRFTAEAANAFLKTLEEPPPASLIFLLTSNRAAVLPTLVSRCQPVRFEPYAEAELVEFLKTRGVAPARAELFARVADGNARKALALGEPGTVTLLAWAGALLERIHDGDAAAGQLAAEMLHKGVIPPGTGPDGEELPAPPPAPDLAGKRDRSLRLCEMLNLYYSDLLACRERGDEWRPRHLEGVRLLRGLAKRRTSPGLLGDLALIEQAKGDLDRNLNIGLTMAVLLQRLITNAEQDRASAGP